MKYRKKPVVIEAVQFKLPLTTDKLPDGVEVIWVSSDDNRFLEVYDKNKPNPENGNLSFGIKTLEGWHIVTSGDWIITGVAGEKYPCKPDIFDKTYEKVY